MNIPPRKLLALVWFPVLAALMLAIACGGGGDDSGNTQPGQLTDPQSVPTATPWSQAPDVVMLDPNNIQPLPTTEPVNTGTITPSPVAGEPGVCGQTYTVISGDTMFGIADKCSVSEPDLEAANPQVDPHNLSVGDVLTLPAALTDTPTPTP